MLKKIILLSPFRMGQIYTVLVSLHMAVDSTNQGFPERTGVVYVIITTGAVFLCTATCMDFQHKAWHRKVSMLIFI